MELLNSSSYSLSRTNCPLGLVPNGHYDPRWPSIKPLWSVCTLWPSRKTQCCVSQGNESLSLIRSQIYLFRYISAAARRCSDSFAIAIVIIIVRSFVDYNWKGWCSSARSRCTEENICEGLVTLVQYFILILKHVDKNDDKPLRSVHDIYSSIWGLYWNEDGWRLAGGFASTSTSVLFWQFWREREIWKLAPKQYWNVWWGSDVRSSHQWHFSNKKYGFYF